tara:strand:+ start:5362 stop:6189 length:828 start_codon:yes stop_codon:yes gene_type:complete
METLRKVKNALIYLMGVVLIFATPSCTSDGLNGLLGADEQVKYAPALQEIIDDQECCFMEYGVKNAVEGRANKISRESAVLVHVQQSSGRFRGTGTYFKYRGHHIVVTAAHIWAESPPTILTSGALIEAPHEEVIGKLVYWDPYVDIAILRIPSLESRKAAKFVRDPQYAVGETVVYSGFPGQNSLLTFVGELAGDGYGTDLAMHSLAWGGSSGSGVFDIDGRFVGVVSSIMVGRGFFGPQLVGSIVYVAPANLIDMQYLRQNLQKLKEKKNARF